MDPEPPSPPGNLSLDEVGALPSLEQRVRRLEETLASLQNVDGLEERIAERVRSRLQSQIMAEFPQGVPLDAPLGLPPLPARWLLGDLWADLRDLVAMWMDHRYRVAWMTQFFLLVLVALILTSHWWFPPSWILGVGPFLDKGLDLVLAFGAFKILSREVRRYRRAVGKE